MKILQLAWKSYGNLDIAAAFREVGHTVIEYPYSDNGERDDKKLVEQTAAAIRKQLPDAVFSFNYLPSVAIACHQEDIPYLAWVYDSPFSRLYHYSLIYPTNYVFLFDQAQYLEFHQGGIPTVYYLPLAANVKRLDRLNGDTQFLRSPLGNKCDIAFVGSLYAEKHRFYERMKGLPASTQGYLEGIMAAQKQVYGYNFIQELLTPDIIKDMQSALPIKARESDSTESLEYLYAQYVINRQITSEERRELLTLIGEHYPIDLYSPPQSSPIPGCISHGTVDYYDATPYVYRHARINLNITLRSIHTGIPLRAFDIMGAGGFLLTNYQADFMNYFTPNVDYVYFESKDDLLSKIRYYLSHEEERSKIAQNGHQKVLRQHNYTQRVQEMLSYL